MTRMAVFASPSYGNPFRMKRFLRLRYFFKTTRRVPPFMNHRSPCGTEGWIEMVRLGRTRIDADAHQRTGSLLAQDIPCRVILILFVEPHD